MNHLKQIYRVILILLGSICVLLGVLGMFLPVLPTTPFLLLAALFYARSSDRFYHWLTNNRWFGTYIRNYQEGRGMSTRQKGISLTLLWVTISLTAWLVVTAWWLRLLLLGIAAGVTIFLVKLKPRPDLESRGSTSERG